MMGVSRYINPLFASFIGYVVAASSSAGCQSSNEVDVQTTYNVTLGERRYLLWFPENYEPTEPAPLILSYQYVFSVPTTLHEYLSGDVPEGYATRDTRIKYSNRGLLKSLNSGGSRDAERQQALDLLSTSYFNKDYVVVYPNGVDVSRLLSTKFWLPRFQWSFGPCWPLSQSS